MVHVQGAYSTYDGIKNNGCSAGGALKVLTNEKRGGLAMVLVHCKACLGEIEQYNYNVSY